MSLTSLLKYSATLRDRMKGEFIMPSLGTTRELAAPPLTKNYSLVGTAFDYLLRFHIERLNPESKKRKWVAQEVIFGDKNPDDLFIGPCPRKFREVIASADKEYAQFQKDGKLNEKLLRMTLCLAQVDVCYRRDVDDLYYQSIGKTNKSDVKDLQSLITLVNEKMFKARKECVLNPTFGKASKLVGGADCDIVVDDTLIEIKTTKEFKLKREYFDQLIGYYILFRIGGIDGASKKHSIKRLGIYFSRHGYLWLFNVSDVINEKRFLKFLGWFKKYAMRVQSAF